MIKKAKLGFKLDIQKYGMIIALVTIVILFQILTDGVLLKPMNVSNLVMQNSYILILAMGMLPCILTGNIDLSVGSIVAFVGAIAGVSMVTLGLPVPVAVLLAILVGFLAGAWQGFWIAYVRVPAFIVTLAGMLIFRGLTMVILQGNTLSPFPEHYQFVASGFLANFKGAEGMSIHLSTVVTGIIVSVVYVLSQIKKRKQQEKYGVMKSKVALFIGQLISMMILINVFTFWLACYKGLPVVLILLAILILFYSFLTNKTVIGRHIYALGGNEKATKLSGIKTNRVLFLTYINMGVMAALAGLVYAGRLNAAAPGAGNGFELDAIAACYIGGASASGGVGTIAGAIVGGLVMAVLNNGMSIMGVGIDWQQAIKGLVLLLAVAFDIYSRSKQKAC